MSQRNLSLEPVSNLPSRYCQGASRVNRSVLPGSEKARMMTVTSGMKCSDLLRSAGPLGYLEKTLLGSSEWNSTMRLLIWKVQGTPAGLSIFQLSPLEHGMRGKGSSSLLPTPDTMPNAPKSTANRKYPKNLLQAARDHYVPQMFSQQEMLPTARGHEVGGYQYSRGNHDKKVLTLTGAIQMMPTASALCGHNIGTFQEWGGAGNKLRGLPEACLPLNPDWEEWFMGFPPGWTKLSDKNVVTFLEKRLSRSKSIRSRKRLQKLLNDAKERAGIPD